MFRSVTFLAFLIIILPIAAIAQEEAATETAPVEAEVASEAPSEGAPETEGEPDLGSFDDLSDDQKDAIKDSKKKPEELAKDIDLEGTEFKTDFRVGLLNLTGNTRSLSVSGGNHTKYRYKRFENNWRVGGYYAHVFSVRSNAGLTGTTARYIYGVYRLDYYILQRLTFFAGGGGYTDRFSGIELAGMGFGGLRYFFLRSPTYYLSGALGYDYQYEDRVAPSPSVGMNSALLELSYWQKLNEHVWITEDVKVLEDVVHGNNLRVTSETELKVGMTKHLALVVGFDLRFRNRPVPGFKKLDTVTEFLLSVNF